MMQVELVRQGYGVALMSEAISLVYPELIPLNLNLPRGPRVDLFLITPQSIRNLPHINATWEAIRTIGSVEMLERRE